MYREKTMYSARNHLSWLLWQYMAAWITIILPTLQKRVVYFTEVCGRSTAEKTHTALLIYHRFSGSLFMPLRWAQRLYWCIPNPMKTQICTTAEVECELLVQRGSSPAGLERSCRQNNVPRTQYWHADLKEKPNQNNIFLPHMRLKAVDQSVKIVFIADSNSLKAYFRGNSATPMSVRQYHRLSRSWSAVR